MYLNVCVCDDFWAARNGKKRGSFKFFRPNLPQLGLFHPYFVSKSSFIVIPMINIVILEQSKQISLYLKIKKSKNPKFVNCTFIIHKNGNKTSIQPILISNSTSFMFINIFCEMKGKNVIHWGGRGETQTAMLQENQCCKLYQTSWTCLPNYIL